METNEGKDQRSGLRINRYIVGCKCFSEMKANERSGWINRYIVGCKWISCGQRKISFSELIDT